MRHDQPNAKRPAGAEEPFPWRCHHCGQVRVRPVRIDYADEVQYDGRLVSFVAKDVEIPICQNCGEKVFTLEVDDQLSDALRSHLQLLTPSQIRDGIEKLGMSQKEMAARLGVAEATLSRWVNNVVIQSRAMDNYLRVFFRFPEVRAVLSVPPIESTPNIINVPDAAT
jgi:putative zinc finger/helix-turn-helix YgiT family protein